MGSDQAGKNEIEPAALAAADLYICDSISQCETSGELEAARAVGLDLVPRELGDILTGKVQGRRSADDITICDLTGTGAQDTAIATHALSCAGEAGTVIKI